MAGADFYCRGCGRTVSTSKATTLRCPYCSSRDYARRPRPPCPLTEEDHRFLRSVRLAWTDPSPDDDDGA